MIRDLARLAERQHDVLVIGGGIQGLAIAYDAAQRGLSVALVERGDFGSGTSFNSLKTIHGGLRSLQTGNLLRAREGVLERRTLARLAPHLLQPLGFLLPIYRSWTHGRLTLGIGLALDRWLGRDRNDGVAAHLRLPAGRLLNAAECLARVPEIARDGLAGGACWHDYQMMRSERLTMAFAIAADAQQACLANYVEATAPVVRDGRLLGIRARDVLGDRPFEIRARLTINAGGPWAGAWMAALGVPRELLLQKALNLVTTRPGRDVALGGESRTGRQLFLVPWNGRLIAGTAHSPRAAAITDHSVTPDEVADFVDDVNDAFPHLRLDPREVTLVHRGLVPAVRVRGQRVAQQARPAVVDHAPDGVAGAITVIAVKYTTARGVAEQAVDLALQKLGRPHVRSRTATVPLPGGDIADVAEAVRTAVRAFEDVLDEDSVRGLVTAYGSECGGVARVATNVAWRTRISPRHSVTAAEIVYVTRHEMVARLTDVVARRTSLGSAGYPGDGAARACGELVARELGWTDDRLERELEDLKRFYST